MLYRTIAQYLSPCISCKLLEHFIFSSIMKYLENYDLLFKNQHGFRKTYSCDTQLIHFIHELHRNLDKRLQTDVIFIDFSKAFDKVPHQRLLQKLTQLRIHNSVITWIKNFLSDRTQYTVVNESRSPLSRVTSGVPQGSVLGPLLFLIYVNDLPANLTSEIRLFADDCALYRPISNNNDHLLLQADLLIIEEWCQTWQMTVNVNKTKLVSFTRSQSPSLFSYQLNDTIIDPCTSYKYLGVHLTCDLSWATHINFILSKAKSSLGYLRRNLKLASPEIKQLSYITFVRSRLEYASSVWSPWQHYLVMKLEAIQNRALRFIFSDYSRFTSVTGLRSKANLHTLSFRRILSRLALFHKLYYNNASIRASLFLPPHSISLRHDNSRKVRPIFSSTVSFYNSYLPMTIKDWNKLPDSVVTETNSDRFAEELINYLELTNMSIC